MFRVTSNRHINTTTNIADINDGDTITKGVYTTSYI